MANSSRNYKVIAQPIKNVLHARSRLDNTVQIGMPFVKATTTIDVGILGTSYADCLGFTLGTHAYHKDILTQDIYAPSSGVWIGYTYTTSGETKPVYTQAESGLPFLDTMFSNTQRIGESAQPVHVPPPNITSVTVGRNKNGLLASANIQFTVSTLEQLEFLHRTFLIPGVGMVLEWGQQFAPDTLASTVSTATVGESGLVPSNIDNFLFPWHDRSRLETYLGRLGKREVGMEEILRNHVYPTQGQYMWMFGRVGNFHVNNVGGDYECSVRIIGPSEDAYAYTTRNTIIPRVDFPNQQRPLRVPCADATTSVDTYFSDPDDTPDKYTFRTLLQKVYTDKEHVWNGHVQKLAGGNKISGEDTSTAAGDAKSNFANLDDAYFISWRFFVNVVLNGDLTGDGKSSAIGTVNRNYPTLYQLLQDMTGGVPINVLRPYAHVGSGRLPNVKVVADPYEHVVGANKFLRSIDPSTMIIVNETATEEFLKYITNDELLVASDESRYMLAAGDFFGEKFADDTDDMRRLSTGVWINHKAIVECMTAGDTILRGISLLLDRMSAATRGFWQLAIDVSEPESGVNTTSNVIPLGAPLETKPISYTVVDLNHRLNATTATAKFIDDVHTFNKYIRTDANGQTLGSDVLECSVNLDLPKRLFTQIALLGLVQPDDINSVQSGQESGQPVILGNDANSALRSMFAITTISTKNSSGRSIDRSIPEYTPVDSALAQCKSKIETAPLSNAVSTAEILLRGKTTNTDRAAQTAKYNKILSSSLCMSAQCTDPANTQPLAPIISADTSYITTTPWSAAFISFIMKSSGTQFPASGVHTTYAQKIRDGFGDWAALDPKTTKIQVGDVVVQNRAGNRQRFTSTPWTGLSHGDVVVSISNGYIEAIGGNLGDTVKMVTYPVYNSTRGTIADREKSGTLRADTFFAVLRPPATAVPAIVDTARAELEKWTNFGWTETSPAALDSLNAYYGTVGLRNNLVTGTLRDGVVPVPQRTPECDQCEKARTALGQLQQEVLREETTPVVRAEQIRRFKHLKKVFRYIEPLPDLMVGNIALLSDGNSSNAFGAAPGTLSISADIILPGINGLRVGELFWIDRIPLFYRAFGAFQVLSLEENITPAGWVTKIHARFNYLGKAWKDAMAKRIQRGLDDTQPSGFVGAGTRDANSSTF